MIKQLFTDEDCELADEKVKVILNLRLGKRVMQEWIENGNLHFFKHQLMSLDNVYLLCVQAKIDNEIVYTELEFGFPSHELANRVSNMYDYLKENKRVKLVDCSNISIDNKLDERNKEIYEGSNIPERPSQDDGMDISETLLEIFGEKTIGACSLL